MPKLTTEDAAEFQRLAEMDGVILTEDEARQAAIRLILLYRHLARPTLGEVAAAKKHRGELLALLLTNIEDRTLIHSLKRGHRRCLAVQPREVCPPHTPAQITNTLEVHG